MHIAFPELGILGANGIVGAGLPIATGAAMSAKLQNNGRVALCFFGDGASNQGTFHEAINIASAFYLPVIYVCENNLYGVGTRQTNVRKVEDIAIRAQAYDIPGIIADGNDVEEVYNVVSQAVQRARAKKGPTLIEFKTYRWHTHFEGEPDTYRPREEVKEWIAKDPIQSYRERLLQTGIISTKILDDIEKEVIAEINRAVEYAKNSPVPDIGTAIEEVYA